MKTQTLTSILVMIGATGCAGAPLPAAAPVASQAPVSVTANVAPGADVATATVDLARPGRAAGVATLTFQVPQPKLAPLRTGAISAGAKSFGFLLGESSVQNNVNLVAGQVNY